MKILVTGADGQVGKELQFISQDNLDIDFIFVNKSNLDIINEENVNALFSTLQPDICINCAAYTAVDKAETDVDLCHKVNAMGPLYLAQACANHHKTLIHLSTDYVYNLSLNRPLQEDDETNPIGEYATSKREGERHALAANPATIIVRTSWVYSSFGHNFVKTMLRLGADRDSLSIVSDQIGTPTYARDIANVLVKIAKATQEKADHKYFGIYNFSNAESTNWADFARKIFEIKSIECTVENMTTAAYNAAAHRPLWSVLSKEKIKNTFDLEIRSWTESVNECLGLL